MEKKKSYTWQYFIFLLEKLRTCIVLSVIFAFCGFPLEAASRKMDSIAAEGILLSLAIVSIAGGCVICLAAPFITMKHLYTKPLADNILSLPLTSLQRYGCEVGAAIAVYAVPHLLSLPLSYFLGAQSYRNTSFYSAVVTLLAMLMFMSFNIFLAGFCGRFAEAVIYPVLMNAAVPLFVICSIVLSREGLYGIIGAENLMSSPYFIIFVVTSPAGYLSFFWNNFDVFTTEALLSAPIFSAVFLALGYIVYKKRPVENIGQPFVYKYGFSVNSLLIAVFLTISCISYQTTEKKLNAVTVMVTLALLLILMLIMEFINYRRIGGIVKFALKYIGTAGVSALAAFLLYTSDGFGETWVIPSAESCAYVSVTIESGGSGLGYLNVNAEGDSELADILREEQLRLIKERSAGYGDTMTMAYTLKNGTSLCRYYSGVKLSEGLREAIAGSDEYKFSGLNDLRVFLERSRELWDEPDGAEIVDPYTGESIFEARIDWSRLEEALTADLENDECFGRHDEAPAYRLFIGEYSDSNNYIYVFPLANYMIYDSYVNTNAYLRQFGIVPTAESSLEKALKSGVLSLSRVCTEDGENSVITRIWSVLGCDRMSAVFLKGDEMKEIARHCAEYVCGAGQEYVYFIRCGVPDFFYINSSASGINDEYAAQLRKDGLLDTGWFVTEGDGYTESYYRYYRYEYENGSRLLINEEYYPELEKYFSGGDREVYSYTYSDESDGDVSYGSCIVTTAEDMAEPAVTTAVPVGEAHVSIK